MKKLLLIGGVAVMLIGGLVITAFAVTTDAVKATDEFLTLLGEGKTRETLEATASAFRANETEQSLAAVAGQLGLVGFQSARWHARQIQNNVATLEGTATTRDGAAVPLTVKLVKEDGRWKVLSLSGPQAGSAAQPTGKSVPSDAALKNLVNDTMTRFTEAVRRDDFTEFYAGISELWKSQISAEKLQQVFQQFSQRHEAFAATRNAAPIFDEPPVIDENGLLILRGYYATAPQRVLFRLKYTYEHPQWKLFGIEVGFHEPSTERPPGAPEEPAAQPGE